MYSPSHNCAPELEKALHISDCREAALKKVEKTIAAPFGNTYFQCKRTIFTSSHLQLGVDLNVALLRSICSSPCPAFKSSFTFPEKKVRHVLVNHKGDATGGGDAYQVGDHAFVETEGAFVPAEKTAKKIASVITDSGAMLRT